MKILKKLSHLNEINILLTVVLTIFSVENLFENEYVEHIYFFLVLFVLLNLLSLYLCKGQIKRLHRRYYIERERQKSKNYNNFIKSYYGTTQKGEVL